MILRPLHLATRPDAVAQSASKVFLATEKQARLPFAIIFQPEHSELAGRLAELLMSHVFGELPPAVIRAISQHDFGWWKSDEAQMNARAERTPRPFPALSTEETLPSWYESVSHARTLGPLEYVIVSRHFTTLATGDEQRAGFARAESAERAEVEQRLGYAASDLDRWTGAIGFCDLASLYLCCGCEEPVEFPLAHPADPASANAPKTTLSFNKGTDIASLRFSPRVLQPGAKLGVEVRTLSAGDQNTQPMRLEWQFPQG